MDENAVAVQEKAVTAISEERSVEDVMIQVEKVQDLMGKVLIEGEHYGPSFPGDKKKNLLKPGVDKLLFTFRLVGKYDERREDLPNGHREYFVKTRIVSQVTGALIAEGLGSCSTMESKYRWRKAARVCPTCGAEAIMKGNADFGGGWYCSKKKEGCGANFADDDPAIISQEVGKYENPDIADTYNSVLKVAKKRSCTDGAISALAVSDMFSQDAEDYLESEHETRNVTPKKEAKPKAKPKPDPKDDPPMKKVNGTTIPEQESPEVAALRSATEAIAARMTTARDDLKAIMSDPMFTADEKALAERKRKTLDMDGTTVLFSEKNAKYLESLVKEYRDKLSEKIEALAGQAPETPAQENLDPLKDETPPAARPLDSAIGKLKASAEAQRQEVPPAETKTTEPQLDIF